MSPFSNGIVIFARDAACTSCRNPLSDGCRLVWSQLRVGEHIEHRTAPWSTSDPVSQSAAPAHRASYGRIGPSVRSASEAQPVVASTNIGWPGHLPALFCFRGDGGALRGANGSACNAPGVRNAAWACARTTCRSRAKLQS